MPASPKTCRAGGDRPSRVLLISPPWRLANWPSLSVGVLKAHLARQGIPADGLHLHLDVALRFGLSRYQTIAAGWELGEALYFALSSGEDAAAILERTAEQLRRKKEGVLAAWATLDFMAEVERATLDALDAVDLYQYHLVGISTGALQLGASVYLAKILRQRHPKLHVVLGGGSVLGEPGGALLRRIPWIDAIVDGEGEQALTALADAAVWDDGSFESIPNLRYRRSDGELAHNGTRVIASLDETSPPDMDEFYRVAHRAGYPRSELVMPVEASRGCAWEHRMGDGRLHGCTFCGLYRNSPNFREKRLETVIAEIKSGVARSQALELSFVDAYLPPSYAKNLLREISKAAMDVTLFCEMRCDLDEEITDLLMRAGARHVQLGVEAFHTRILARMAKGTRMIDNVSSIKLCEEYGIRHQYNLITHFPGVQMIELREMIRLLPLLYGFKPPTLADFYLDRGSRIFMQPQRFGICADSVDRDPLSFLPSSMATAGLSQVVPAETAASDEVRQGWDALESTVAIWRAKHDEARAQGVEQVLTYRDTGEALVVTDWRKEDSCVLELEGPLRAVLLGCDRMVRREELRSRAPELDPITLNMVLDQLRGHGLMIEEGDWLLGLPVRSRLPNGAPRVWCAHA